MSVTGTSQRSLRELNRLRVVDALRRTGAASRSELTRQTGLSRSTVSTAVNDLLGRGLLEERADADGRAGRSGRGRPPTLLSFHRSAGAAIGVDFGHGHIRVAVADLSSRLLAERRLDLDVDHEAETALEAATTLVAAVLVEAGVERGQVIAAGMGIPGPIDLDTGSVGSSVILPGWIGVRAAHELSERLGRLPVVVDNDANLAALAEVTFGSARGLRNVIYIKLSTGVGAGLVLDGRLHRGAAGLAGEFGHLQVRPEGAVCRCGSRGCLETIVSTDAVVSVLRPSHGADLDVTRMLDLVVAGDRGAGRVVNDVGRTLGQVLGGIANLLNPEAIVIGGDLVRAGAPLLDGIRESLDRYALSSVAGGLTVRPGVLGERAEVLGALALVIGDTDRLRSANLAALRDESIAAA